MPDKAYNTYMLGPFACRAFHKPSPVHRTLPTNLLQAALDGLSTAHYHHFLPNQGRLGALRLGNLGERGLTLSRSRQQGRSTAYRTRTHIKVVCRGFVPARPKLQSARRRRLTSEAAETQPDGAQGRSLFSHVCARGSIAAFRHGF